MISDSVDLLRLKMVAIFVKSSGRTVALSVESTSTIESIKASVESFECSLFFAGAKLADNKTVADYCLPEDAILNIHAGLQGEGKKKRKKKNYTKPKVIKHKNKKIKMAITKYYKVDDAGKITRLRRECTAASCGAATFMAFHYDRYTCGKCGYTLAFENRGAAPQKQAKKEEVKEAPKAAAAKGKGKKK